MENSIREFFTSYILPINRRIETKKVVFLEENRDEIDSFFSSPKHPKYLYFDHIPFENASELEAYLKTFWKNDPELLVMIDALVILAFQLKEKRSEESSDLSDFIYTMY